MTQFDFPGAAWTNQLQVVATPGLTSNEGAWAFVVSGRLESERNLNGYLGTARNRRTNAIMRGNVQDGYFAVAFADLSRRSIVQVGDTLEVTVTDTTRGNCIGDVQFHSNLRHACKRHFAGNT